MRVLRKGDALPTATLRRGEMPLPALDAVVTYRELYRLEHTTAILAAQTANGDNDTTTQPALDLFYASIVAAGAIDPESGEALWATDEILSWPSRADLWSQLRDLGGAILALSEVGDEALKSGDPPADAG